MARRKAIKYLWFVVMLTLLVVACADDEGEHGPYPCDHAMEIQMGDDVFVFHEGECIGEYGDGNLEVECLTDDMYAQVGFQSPGEGYFEMSIGEDFYTTENAHIQHDITDDTFTGEFSCVLDAVEINGCFNTEGETY